MSEQRDLRADLELCNKATHGKWQASYDDDIKDDVRVCQVENGECVCCLALMGNYDYDLGEWHYGDITEWRANADFIAAARTGWPEAIERAIKAESKNTESYDLLYSVFDTTKEEAERLKDDNAALREENDLQRHSIQQLSAQVAAYRKAITDCPIEAQDGCNCPDCKAVRRCEGLIYKPDPGAEIMERMRKMEAVAEAAKIMFGEIDARTRTRSLDMGGKHGLTMQVKQGDAEYWRALNIYNQALADLAAVTPCT